MRLKGRLSIGDIGPIALALGVAVIVIAIVSLVLSNMTAGTYLVDTVDNETFNASADPYTYTVTEAGSADFVSLDAVTCYESTAQTTELADNNCNVSDAEAGEVKLSTALDDGDESLAYDYSHETTATTVLDKGKDAMGTFADWFNIIVIVAVAAIILGLVMLFRGTFGRTTVSK